MGSGLLGTAGFASGTGAGGGVVDDGALCLHAQELAARQRTEMRAPGRSYDASRWNRCVDMTADLITPGAEEARPPAPAVSSAVAQSARSTLSG